MYKTLFLILLFSIALYAKNPYPFAALGDVIYENADKVQKLKNIDGFSIYNEKIQKYLKDVKRAKEEGFALEAGKKKDKKAYLNKLRALAKEYDLFRRSVEVSFQDALKDKNVKLVEQLINSGLLDTNRYKKEILDFYFNHVGKMSTKGLIESYLDEDAKLRKKREAQRKRYLSKKQRELERIKRIRKKDKLEQERLEKQLQEELIQKKKEIQAYQKKELSKTR